MSTQSTLFAHLTFVVRLSGTHHQPDRAVFVPLAKSEKCKPGEILFEPGDIDIPFFVLLPAGMEIVQPDLHGERLIVTHGPANSPERSR